MRETGAKLRAAREARHLSLDDVTRCTHLPLRTLTAFEEGRVADLPPPLYARSFLRQYATLLDLPPEELVADLDRELPLAPAPDASVSPHGHSARSARGSLAGTVALLLLALGSALFYRHTLTIDGHPGGRIANATSPTETAAPTVGTVPTATPSPSLPRSSPTAPSLAVTVPMPTATPLPESSPTSAPTPPPPSPTPAKPTAGPAATPARPAAPRPPAATQPAVAAAVTERPQTALPPPPSDSTRTPDHTATPAATYHVRPGDTLTAIARRYGLSVTDIARGNDVTDPRKLRAGQTLRLPR